MSIILLGFVFNLFFCEIAFSNNGYEDLRNTFEDKYSILSPLQKPPVFIFGTQELSYSGTCFLNSSAPGVSFQINGTPTYNGYRDYILDFISENDDLQNVSADILRFTGKYTKKSPVLSTNYTNGDGKEVLLQISQRKPSCPDQPMEAIPLIVRIQIYNSIWWDKIYVCKLSPVEDL